VHELTSSEEPLLKTAAIEAIAVIRNTGDTGELRSRHPLELRRHSRQRRLEVELRGGSGKVQLAGEVQSRDGQSHPQMKH
jgi:hypothetical protein